MPELDDERDDIIDEGDDASDDSASGEKPDESKEPKTPESDKRVKDFQSKADAAEARANKAEARLKTLESAFKVDNSDDSKPPKSGNASTDSAIIDMARMFAYQQNPKLADYGVEMSDISGSTPSEIARNATDIVARFEKIETKARNKVLAEQGLAPEISGGETSSPKRDFSTMPKKDFDAFVEAAMKGQRPG